MSGIRVGVLGAAGRMGRTVCEAVEGDAELELVAGVDTTGGEGISRSRESLLDAGTEVVVDFTSPDSVMGNIRYCVSEGMHCVVGTTGLLDVDLDEIAALVGDGPPNVFVAPNFSVGAVLMMHFAEQAARYFGSAEIVELHHNRKLDAPSGTALRTAKGVAEAWRTYGRPEGGEPHPDEKETVTGARGAELEGVHIHAVRLQGLVAHQEVVLGGPGETLSVRHDSLDRVSFMPGVLLAVKSVAAKPGLTVGLGELLDLG